MSQIRQWSRPDIRRVSIDGVAVAIEIVRSGTDSNRTVAWIHGLGSASTLAFAKAARHARLSRVTSLLIDLPGHGLSDKPGTWSYTIEDHATIVMDAVDHVISTPVTLFGHSMGGSIAITCAVKRPEAVQRLLVAEPNRGDGTGRVSAHIAAQSQERFVERGYKALVRATERSARNGDTASIKALPTLKIASPAALYRSSVSLLAPRSPSFEEQLLDLAMPTATITGEYSQSPVPPLLDGRLRGYVVSKAGHDMIAENLDGFTAALAAALDLPGMDDSPTGQ